MKQQTTKIGIIGGLGPQASVELYRYIIDQTAGKHAVKSNRDYPEVVIHSLPLDDFITDTKYAAIGKKKLINALSELKQIGCNYVGIACNTVHLFEDEFRRLFGDSFISLTGLVQQKIKFERYNRVGIIATPTTVKYKLYGQNQYLPDLYQPTITQLIHRVIGGTTTPVDSQTLKDIIIRFSQDYNFDAIVIGCTELSLLTHGLTTDIPIISSLHVFGDGLLDIINQELKG